MANVFGNGSNRNCSSGSGILPAPRPSVVPARSVASTPNVFKGDGATPEQLNPRDFYTRREVDRYLSDKADLSNVYTREETYSSNEVDQLLTQLNITSYASIAYVDSSISSQVNAINADLNSNYYDKTQTYSKSEVNNLISTADIGDSYLSKTPATLDDITLVPSVTDLPVSLVVRSSNNDLGTQVQKWENASTDLVAAIYADGQATITNLLTVGENVSVGGVAVDASERRIAGVADPVDNLDAVNKSYMETWITGVISDITQDQNENYLIDALEY